MLYYVTVLQSLGSLAMSRVAVWRFQDRVLHYQCPDEIGLVAIAEIMPIYLEALEAKPEPVHLLIDFSQVKQIQMSLVDINKVQVGDGRQDQGRIIFIMRRAQKFYGLLTFLSRTIIKNFPLPYHLVEDFPSALTLLQIYDPPLRELLAGYEQAGNGIEAAQNGRDY
jgi:hypothetical protein